MPDEDCAIGLTVQNLAGEKWAMYGNKCGLNKADVNNLNRCLVAEQGSADEIYKPWKTK